MNLKHTRLFSVATGLGLFLASGTLQAKVTLPSLFSDNMVFQQKTKVPVWGRTDAGKTVSITTSWNNKPVKGQADAAGNFKIFVNTPSYGGPYTVSISDGEELTLKNILVGDVWVCSGQSNMEMPLAGWGKINNYEQEIKDANYPKIRLLQGVHVTSNKPLDDAKVTNGGWTECTPQYIGEFSSVAYFFAREITRKTGIPIGLIHTSWGGTIAEAWTSAETLRTLPDFSERLAKIQGNPDDTSEKNNPNRVSVLYNAMIHPYIQFPVKGAIWYQGESNADRANQYRTLFPAMIKDWRTKWGVGDFPFYFVQLANFMKTDDQPVDSKWAELRDAQKQTLSLKNTGMAVIIDVGDAADIHPKNKQDVGKRLAYIALAKNYGVKIPYSGPAFKSQQVSGNTIRLNFTDTYGGLKARDGAELKGFAIAGADRKFYWAKATIQGNQVVVSSDEVTNPVAVRYAWANNPPSTLYNDADLPASPFKTDNWTDVTTGQK
ncbi:sialate O-acetylesterase [Pedobacter sp. JY14-1]|uniref:sialate O-acetylesterase n=1 Tax=Pedobacter sp. JY14-1 TaxID=3034151 RepID=UPI0023E280AE|nr:sialate O-acetylesterase [Pedobacter sp. JY14-1]